MHLTIRGPDRGRWPRLYPASVTPLHVRQVEGRGHGRRERVRVVGAVAAPPVDEEDGRSRDTAEVGPLHVLGDPGGTAVPEQGTLEAFRVETRAGGVLAQVRRTQRALVGQQQVVHLSVTSP